MTRAELLQKLRAQYTDLGNAERAIERKHEEIRATIAALDACTEGPAVAPEIRLAAAMRYGKPWPL